MDGCPQVLKQEAALAAFAKRHINPDRGEAESQDLSGSKAVCGDELQKQALLRMNPSKGSISSPTESSVAVKGDPVLLIVEVCLSLLTYQTEVMILSLPIG